MLNRNYVPPFADIGKLWHLKKGFASETSKPNNVWHIWFFAIYHKYDEKPLSNGLKGFQNKKAIRNCSNEPTIRLIKFDLFDNVIVIPLQRKFV